MVTRTESDATEEGKTLFDDLEDQGIDPNRVNKLPYIRFRDEGGFDHRLAVRKWGAFILLAKPEYQNNPDVLWRANGYRSDHDMILVVGNMSNYRTNWLIIKTFEIDKPDNSPNLFDSV